MALVKESLGYRYVAKIMFTRWRESLRPVREEILPFVFEALFEIETTFS
jgi:hypothetical protein